MYAVINYHGKQLEGNQLVELSFDSMRLARVFLNEVYSLFKAYPSYVNGCTVIIDAEVEKKYRWR